MLTIKQFKELYPRCKNPKDWVNAMKEVFPKFGIDTPKRIAAFISQCGHESAGWRYFSENLNYSAKALDTVFRKYFAYGGRNAYDYERQPEKIANVVYANRMGNGDSFSGDGWRYRGRGPIQLTGKNNYTTFSSEMNVDAVTDPDIVSNDFKVSLMSAIWFWNTNGLNRYADEGDIKTMTKRINGGYIGLEDRLMYYVLALDILDNTEIVVNPVRKDTKVSYGKLGVLRRGSRGSGVKQLQRKLGLKDDGDFGPGTERTLKNWQRANGLQDDGIAGPFTLNLLFSTSQWGY